MADYQTLPELPWATCNFDPVSPTSVSRMEGRRAETMAFGTPYWTMKLATNWLEEHLFGLFDAFIMKADARGKPLLAHDVFRPRPIAMDTGAPLSGTKAGGGAFNGDVFFQSVSANTLYLGGLPAGFIFTAGDYIEVRSSVLKRSLHRIIEPTVSDANGFATVEIMYPLDTQNFNATCTGHLETPSCLMMIDPGSVQAPKSWGSREGSFSATEIFFS
ncbi:hypothetical protein [Agrobacterium tumefaciens]|uniref:hypothetical protein n=1 Tax=Agrobacterium tumefaciens TaxID=358 RepID=UPI0015733FB6|nr:hypothetical protein [Agrobacterium tumefaciens]NTD88656.1 hypothetical protein [Agrobacterium tumefaciens]NTD91385.1 hypothetical protein [Agrobacterium tumefaciens]NTD98833.1 hypothetical protein [Agrobacterium tumefaciens]NTE12213.1 hypothetical protein [Agrobacterium tumefaciens]NTE20291.1 hypothetical protein [Agrobacterium tumefaciens]